MYDDDDWGSYGAAVSYSERRRRPSSIGKLGPSRTKSLVE